VITPIYFDVESFEALRDEIRALAQTDPRLADLRMRFFVVDDTAGADDRVARVSDLHDTTVIEPPFNLGHQQALVYGLRNVAPHLQDDDIIVTLDADGEDRPSDLPRLVDVLRQRPAIRSQLVLALRTKRRESFGFKVMYLLFRAAFRLLTGQVVRTGNYGAYRGWLARRILLHPYFDLSYSATLITLNIPVEYVPCERGSRYAGESRMTFEKLFAHGLSMLMPFTGRIATRALVGFSVTILGALVLSIVVVGIRLLSDRAVPGWTTYTLLGLIILSLVAFGNLVILFTVFSQSRGISLGTVEQATYESTRAPSPPSD
jgi:hypothetical protein